MLKILEPLVPATLAVGALASGFVAQAHGSVNDAISQTTPVQFGLVIALGIGLHSVGRWQQSTADRIKAVEDKLTELTHKIERTQ